MKEQRLSEMLREIRFALRLNQKEMGEVLSLGEKMYQLYESGQYDAKGEGSVKRQKLLDKIARVKERTIINQSTITKETTPNDFAYQELEKKYLESQQRIMELQNEIIALQKKMLSKTNRAIAHGITPSKRKN